MVRRHPYINRKYIYPKERPFKIPMPNQLEDKDAEKEDIPQRKQSFIHMIKSRIGIEEIILIGLIFLLLKDGIEDQLIIILLIYVLIG